MILGDSAEHLEEFRVDSKFVFLVHFEDGFESVKVRGGVAGFE